MSNSFCDTKIKPESLKLLLIYTNFHKYLYGSQFSLNMKDFFFPYQDLSHLNLEE